MGKTLGKSVCLRVFMPLLFMAYVLCVSMFTHTHVVNGTTIVHSHPSDASASHDHTDGEYQVLEMITHYSATDHSAAVTDAFADVCPHLLEEISTLPEAMPGLHPSLSIQTLRGPPAEL